MEKKFFILASFVVFSQFIFSTTTLLLTSAHPSKESYIKHQENFLRTNLLVQEVAYDISCGISELLDAKKPRALIINTTYADGRFIFHFDDLPDQILTDQELVKALVGRGLACDVESENRTIEFVFLNGNATYDLCCRLQSECGIPVVVGWKEEDAFSSRAYIMGAFFMRLLSLEFSYEQAFIAAAEACRFPATASKLEIYLMIKYSDRYPVELAGRRGAFFKNKCDAAIVE
ncbi:hypothetical protein FJ366_03835 [Candidatus Dependentiae bacterium]|nr:hypothetical protein [Candidatus Dependentiae bacterium]